MRLERSTVSPNISKTATKFAAVLTIFLDILYTPYIDDIIESYFHVIIFHTMFGLDRLSLRTMIYD